MVAVVSGNGLGLFNTSITQLGLGLGGQAGIGQSRESQYVNIATGNLLLQDQDETLLVRGFNAGFLRTYNSRGTVADAGQDGWVTGFERKVSLTAGHTLNATDSQMLLTTGDGQVQVFDYVSANNYRSTNGDGAHDSLVLSGTTTKVWTFTEGSMRREEQYADHASTTLLGRLTRIRDLKSDSAKPAQFDVIYNNTSATARITEVRSVDDQVTANLRDALLFAYDTSGRLSAVTTREGGATKTQLSYGYDTSGRLSWVQTDLTPAVSTDNIWNETTAANNDGLRFRTTYTYIDAVPSSSLLIAKVTQSDGTTVSYTYEDDGAGGNRVKTVTQGSVDDSSAQTVSFTYNANSTDVTDSLNRTWTYQYDAAKQLIAVLEPSIDGQRTITSYTYTTASDVSGSGNVSEIKKELGSTLLSQINYAYDTKGNLLKQWTRLSGANATSTTVIWTYTGSNQVATETQYTGLDTDGIGAAVPASATALKTNYFYDSRNRLQWIVNALGEVTERTYASTGNGIGQLASERRYVDAAFTGTRSAANLLTWSATQKSNSQLAEYFYDVKGRLQETVAYAKLDPANGLGVVDDANDIARYSYDAQGLLLQKILLRGTGRSIDMSVAAPGTSEVSSYVYDGMGRLLSVIVRAASSNALPANPTEQQLLDFDAASVSTTYAYRDASLQIQVTLDSGAMRTQTFNQAGQTTGLAESGVVSGSTITRSIQHFYDTAGQLRGSQDANGARRYFFYDNKGRLEAEVDATGAVTKHNYDGADRRLSTVQYANRVTTSSWLSGSAVTVTDFAAIGVVADINADRTSSNTFDLSGRLLATTDGITTSTNRQIINYTYDGAGRVILISATDSIGTAATARITRQFYDGAGRLEASLDAERYLVRMTYDRAGRLIQTTRYAGKIVAPATVTAATLLAGLTIPLDANNDQTSRYFYNGRGQQIGTLDAQGYLTEAIVDEAGNTRAERRYIRQLSGLTGTENILVLKDKATENIPGNLLPIEYYREGKSAFNSLGQLSTQTNYEGTVSRFTYDENGRLVYTQTAENTSEVRAGFKRYNVFNELIGEISGEQALQANATLPNGKLLNDTTLTETQLNAAYNAYGVTHSYDALSRRIESRDAQGNKTFYFYDVNGRQTFVVKGVAQSNAGVTGVPNSYGEVSETRYSVFGQVTDSLSYTGRILINTPGDRASVELAISTLSFVAASDKSQRQFVYDQRGLLKQSIDALNVSSIYSYNAFGQLFQEQRANATSAVVTSQHNYDKRGLETSRTDALGSSIARTSSQTYDAFGRVITSTNPRGVVTSISYDRLGRQITRSLKVISEATLRTETFTTAYDSYSRTLSLTDALNNVTSYAYSDTNRSMTVTSQEGVVITTVHNRHGQMVAITEANGAVNTVTYDKNGGQLTSTNALNQSSSNQYDVRGLLLESTDATGRKVGYIYDAVGRVLSRIEDPGVGKLNITTTTVFDGQGRQIQVTDAAGLLTTLQYDQEGRLLQVIQDPGAGKLNLTTSYTYDALGRQITVVEGNGSGAAHTMQYVYDVLGRRTQEKLDPSGLNLVTNYLYDANDNVVQRTDATGNVSRFVYDEANRRIYDIDATGGVSKTTYDADGRVIAMRSYATAITVSDLSTTIGASAVTIKTRVDAISNNVSDQISYRLYDRDSRVRFSITLLSATSASITEQNYDTLGRATHSAAYTAALTDTVLLGKIKTGTASLAEFNDFVTINAVAAQQQWSVFDIAGRLRFNLDALGSINEQRYDAAGRVVQKLIYAVALSNSELLAKVKAGTATIAEFAVFTGVNEAHAQQQFSVFDAAGRTRFSVDAVGAVMEMVYGTANRLTQTLRYNASVVLDIPLRSALAAGTETSVSFSARLTADIAHDEVVTQIYDAAGRVRFNIDARGGVTESRYDATGQVTEILSYANELAMTAEFRDQLKFGTMSDANVSMQLAGDVRSQSFVYDSAGRRTASITRIESGAATVSMSTFDAAGRVVSMIAYGVTLPAYAVFNSNTALMAALDAAGAIASVDQRKTQYLYDAAGRLRFSQDASGVVTEQRYDALGRSVRSINYGSALTTVPTSVAAMTAALAGQTDVRVTQYGYDSASRVIQVTDALNKSETFTYDARGQKASHTNRNGQTWTYQYDTAGRQTAEISPQVQVAVVDTNGQVSTQARSIVTRLTYDARGNVVARTEDAEGNQPRTTEYIYDNRGNQIKTIFPDSGRWDAANNGIVATQLRPSTEISYDTLGRAVVEKDVRGNYRHRIYDVAGQLAYEADQAGYVTGYTYNAYGEQISLTRYAAPVSSAAGAAIALENLETELVRNASTDRTIATKYNLRGQKIEVKQSAVAGVDSAGVYFVSSPTSRFAYDSYGQLSRESILLSGDPDTQSAIWAATTRYYDAIGRQELVVDSENYVTRYTYSAHGEVLTQIEYARAIETAVSVHQRPGLPLAGDAATGYDRTIRFAYDALGRKVSETSLRHVADANGAASTRDVATTIQYDAEGRVLATIVDGVSTTTAYDALGRTVAVKESERSVLRADAATQLQANAAINLSSASLYEATSPFSTMAYDAFGNVVQVRRYTNGIKANQTLPTASTTDQIQTTRFDWQGRSIWERDAVGTIYARVYDAADNILESRSRLDGNDGRWSEVVNLAQYDGLGRQTVSQVGRELHQEGTSSVLAWELDTGSVVRYNAFGEIIAKGDASNDLAQAFNNLNDATRSAQFVYDNAGRLIRSNSQGGTWRDYFYNAAGHQTVEGHATLLGGASSTDLSYINAITRTETDSNGRILVQHLPTNTDNQNDSPVVRQRYDRWGNVVEVIDPRGSNTLYQYNELNQAVMETKPTVRVVNADGSEAQVSPISRWFYDALGRLVGTQDANGHIRSNTYDQAGRMLSSTNALNAVTRYGYDALGQQALTQDPLAYLTFREFDQAGRVITQGDFLTNQNQTGRTRFVRESYDLNQNGNRLRVTDALGHVVRYDYDSRGLVVQSRTAMGVVMKYAYDVQGHKIRETNGLSDLSLQADITPVYRGGLLPSRFLQEAQAFTYVVPNNLFETSNGLPLTITEQVSIEVWNVTAQAYQTSTAFSYDLATRTISGNAETGSHQYRITVKASLASGQTTSASMLLNSVPQSTYLAGGYDQSPVSQQGLFNIVTTSGVAFTHVIPSNTFVDPQAQALTYSVYVYEYRNSPINPGNLPPGEYSEIDSTWEYIAIPLSESTLANQISFNTATQTFSGNVLASGQFELIVRATDPNGNSIEQSLLVIANATQGAGSGRRLATDDGEGKQVYLDEQTWSYDVFGRLTDHNDLSGADYDYSYNDSTGQQTEQSTSWTEQLRLQSVTTPLQQRWRFSDWNRDGLNAELIALSVNQPVLNSDSKREMVYYANGQIKEIREGNNWTRYTYDASGNRTSEETLTHNSNGQILHLRTNITFDAHNRIARVTQDDLGANRRLLELKYGYDAVGNRRNVDVVSDYDPTGASISVRDNQAPTLNYYSAGQEQPVIGQDWQFQIPANMFVDPEGGTVTYSVGTASGAPLPAWLQYDASTRTLSGTPTTTAPVELIISATDADGAVSTTAGLSWNANLQIRPITDQPVALPTSQNFIYQENGYLSAEQFFTVDREPASLAFNVTQPDGNPSPFVDGENVFNINWGAMPAGQTSIDLRLEVTSLSGLTSSRLVHCTLNKAPTWSGESIYFAEPNTAWSLQLNTLLMASDVDGDVIVSISPDTLPNDSPYQSLPEWMSFDATTGTLTGTPPDDSSSTLWWMPEGQWIVALVIEDARGGIGHAQLLIDVRSRALAVRPVPEQQVVVGGSFDFSLPTDLFRHRNQATMTYEARYVGLSSGGSSDGGVFIDKTFVIPLPSWLQFDETQLRITGTAPSAPREFVIEIIASDSQGIVAHKYVKLSVINGVVSTSAATNQDGIDELSILLGSGNSYGTPADSTLWSSVPFLAQDIVISVAANQAFSYTVPASILRDLDGQVERLFPIDSLPDGVVYDDATRTFSGTVTSATGRTQYRMGLMDNQGAVGFGHLMFSSYPSEQVVNYAGGLLDQNAAVGEWFEYQIPTGVFTATNGGALYYNATIARFDQASGLALSSQFMYGKTVNGRAYGEQHSRDYIFDDIAINSSTGKITGSFREAGKYLMSVNGANFVIDVAQGTYSDLVSGSVNQNNPGYISLPVQRPAVSTPWTYQIPENALIDPEGGAVTYLSAYVVGSYGPTPLPAWLSFNATTRTFSGTPPSFDGAYIQISARNADGELGLIQLSIAPEMPDLGNGTSPFNPGFEEGDIGWTKGAGWSIVQEPAGDAHTGTWSAVYNGGRGATVIRNNVRSPVLPGQTYTAAVMVQQGASSKGDASAAVVIEWYDAQGRFISSDKGNEVNSGRNAQWHESRVNATAPWNAAYMTIGATARKVTNKPLWVDGFSWSLQSTGTSFGVAGAPKKSYWFDYDAENRVQVTNGKLQNGQIQIAATDSSFALSYDEAGHATSRRFYQNGQLVNEVTQYDQRGQRSTVFEARALGNTALAEVAESFSYDAVGRQSQHRLFDLQGNALKHIDAMQYDADGRLVTQTSYGRSIGGGGYLGNSEAEGLAQLSQVQYHGYDVAGRMQGYTYNAFHHEVGSGATAQDPTGYNHRFVYSYEGRDGYLEKQIYGQSSNANFKASQTASTYDAWGRRIGVREQTPGTQVQDRIRSLAYDMEGNILQRIETDPNITSGPLPPMQQYAYVSGKQVASGKSTGEVDVLGQLTAYDSSETGVVTVTVQAGDSLESIAQRVYGNSSLWYVLAEANATSNAQLKAGTSLKVPEVKVTSNDSATYKPYNANDIIGSTAPTLPHIVPPPKNACGTLGMIIMVVIAIVVTVYTAGAASGLLGLAAPAGATAAATTTAAVGGAALAGGGGLVAAGGLAAATSVGFASAVAAGVGAFVGSVASQAVGSALGVTSFSWRGAVGSGITGALTAGIGGALGGSTASLMNGGWANAGKVAASAVGNAAAGYVGNKIAGVENTHFSWKSIAASAVSSVVTAGISNGLGIAAPKVFGGTGSMLGDFATGMIGGVVSGHVRRQFGFDEKINLGQIAADAFGNALGNATVRKLSSIEADAVQARLMKEAEQEARFNRTGEYLTNSLGYGGADQDNVGWAIKNFSGLQTDEGQLPIQSLGTNQLPYDANGDGIHNDMDYVGEGFDRFYPNDKRGMHNNAMPREAQRAQAAGSENKVDPKSIRSTVCTIDNPAGYSEYELEALQVVAIYGEKASGVSLKELDPMQREYIQEIYPRLLKAEQAKEAYRNSLPQMRAITRADIQATKDRQAIIDYANQSMNDQFAVSMQTGLRVSAEFMGSELLFLKAGSLYNKARNLFRTEDAIATSLLKSEIKAGLSLDRALTPSATLSPLEAGINGNAVRQALGLSSPVKRDFVTLATRAEFRAASKKPLPNTIYEFDGFRYITDARGRGISSSGKLRLDGGGNRFYDDRLIGRQGITDDIAFHGGADEFGFQGGPLNLSPGNKSLNINGYRKLELELKAYLKQGKEVDANFRSVFNKGNIGVRPDKYVVDFRVGSGEWKQRVFLNKKGG